MTNKKKPIYFLFLLDDIFNCLWFVLREPAHKTMMHAYCLLFVLLSLYVRLFCAVFSRVILIFFSLFISFHFHIERPTHASNVVIASVKFSALEKKEHNLSKLGFFSISTTALASRLLICRYFNENCNRYSFIFNIYSLCFFFSKFSVRFFALHTRNLIEYWMTNCRNNGEKKSWSHIWHLFQFDSMLFFKSIHGCLCMWWARRLNNDLEISKSQNFISSWISLKINWTGWIPWVFFYYYSLLKILIFSIKRIDSYW